MATQTFQDPTTFTIAVSSASAAAFSTGISSVSGSVGAPAQATITVTNTGTAAGATVVSGVIVDRGTVEGHMTSVTTGTLQPGASQTLTMTGAGALASLYSGDTLELAVAPGTTMANAAVGSAFPQGLPGETGATFVVAAGSSSGTGTASPSSISPGTLSVGDSFTLDVGVTAYTAGSLTLTGGLYNGGTEVVALAATTITATVGTQVVTMASAATVPSSAAGMTLTPMVSVNGGSLQASGLTVLVETLAGTQGPTSAPSLSVSYDQTSGELSASWSAVSGATDYEIQVLDSAGNPLTGDIPAFGNGTITYDPQGNVGFWTNVPSGSTTFSEAGPWGVRVRGSVGIGATAAVGPWSNVAPFSVTGTAAIGVQNFLTVTPTTGGFYVTGNLVNSGTAAGTLSGGWSAVIVGPVPFEAAGDEYVWGVANDSTPVTLGVGQTYPIAFKIGVWSPPAGAGDIPSGNAFSFYFALDQTFADAGYYIGSYLDPPFPGPPSGAMGLLGIPYP